jgi:predicted DNA-binding mobile mystery protein A
MVKLMNNLKNKLIREQIDRKLVNFTGLRDISVPPAGWIYATRKALNMSLKQLGKKLGITPQGIKEIENREKTGSITLKSLNDIANALNLKLVYALIPNDGTLQALLERAAYDEARKIVMRTSITMKLENQENTEERLQKAIKDKAEEIIREIPKYLWD